MTQWKSTAMVVAALGIGLVAGGVGVRTALAQKQDNTSVRSGLTRSIPAQYNEVPTRGPSSTSNVAPSLKELDTQFADLVESISPSVVHIRSSEMAQGSGVVFRADGWIVTNDHVVSAAKNKKVTVILSDGRELEGTVTASGDFRNDIAVVKVNAKDLVPAPFADSTTVRPGEYAIAVGSPFGLENSVTIGHVSALGRESAAGGMGDMRTYSNMIQTDAAINPGNSGGPLLNINGEVIGINTSILAGSSGIMMGQPGNVGIGFAIPGSQARFIAEKLISKGTLRRGYLGVQMEDIKPYRRKELGIDGGVLVGALPDSGPSPAKDAGIVKGDIITRVGRVMVRNMQDILNSMLEYEPGTKVDVTLIRNGQSKTLSVKVATVPANMNPNSMAAPNAPDPSTPRAPRNQAPFAMPDDMRKRFEDLQKEFRDELAPKSQDSKPQTPSKPGSPAKLNVNVGDITPESRSQYNIPSSEKGALVVEVIEGGIAAKLGMKPGDLITRIGTKEINSSADLVDAMKAFKVGDRTSVSFQRYSGNATSSMTMSVVF